MMGASVNPATNDWYSALNIPPNVQDPLVEEYKRRQAAMSLIQPKPDARMFGNPSAPQSTLQLSDPNAANIQQWMSDRPVNQPFQNIGRGAVGMAAGIPQMIADPASVVEGAVDIGQRMVGIDPDKWSELMKGKDQGYRMRLQNHIMSKGAGEWLSPDEETELQALMGEKARSETRAETALKYPLEVGAMAYGGAKGLAGEVGRPGVLKAAAGPEKEALLSALGPQQTLSRTAKILDEPRYTERQPVSEWIKTLMAKQFPKDEPAALQVLADLKTRPLKERLTKADVQQMLDDRAPQLETVMAKNPTHPEREGELFVRDPNEVKAKYKWEQTAPDRWDTDNYFIDKNNETSYSLYPYDGEAVGEYGSLSDAKKAFGDFTQQPRYDGHSWAQQDKLSEPLGRTGFATKNNADGSKTLVIDNFQKPTEGSGSRSAMPEAHDKRAYDLMTQSVLNYARENGYRDVEWTTGMEQNRRWGVDIPEETGWVESTTKVIGGDDVKRTVPRWANNGYDIVEMNGGFEVAGPSGFITKLSTLEEAKKWVEGKKGSLTVEGDLRPLYDKELPKLMEKHGLGEKVGKGNKEEFSNISHGWDIDPGDMEDLIMAGTRAADPLVRTQARRFNSEFIEEGETFDVILENKPELAKWLEEQIAPEKSDRQAIRVQGQQPQPLIYAKVPLSKLNFMAKKGDEEAQKELKRRMQK